MLSFPPPRYSTWTDAGYYKAIVTIDGAYDFEIIFLVHVQGQISCTYFISPASITNSHRIYKSRQLYLKPVKLKGFDRNQMMERTLFLTQIFQRITSTCQRECLLWTKKPFGFTKHSLQNMFAGRTLQMHLS